MAARFAQGLLAEAGCSPHEIMSVSGHATLKEVERYTRAANRARLPDSAIAALQTAQREGVGLEKRVSKLANMLLAKARLKPLFLNRKKHGMAEWEGVNHPSKINGLQWLTSDFGTTVL